MVNKGAHWCSPGWRAFATRARDYFPCRDYFVIPEMGASTKKHPRCARHIFSIHKRKMKDFPFASVENMQGVFLLAEREGFEPPDLLQSTVFKTASLNRSDISPAQM